MQAVLENVVKKGTGSKLYSKDFSMAGKTGTAQVNYKDKSKLYYASSFVGYFPADEPKYSCIVVVHKPNTSNKNIMEPMLLDQFSKESHKKYLQILHQQIM